MKKMTVFLISMLLILSLTACGSNQSTKNSTEEPTTEASQLTTTEAEVEASENSEMSTGEPEQDASASEETEESKTLIVYFSWSSSGNTEKMAEAIQEEIGGTVYEIVPLNPYPEDYTATTEVAQKEKDDNARPEIKDPLASVEEYDRILVGYPIWWHTAPMIIGTFLESYDLTGIDIYPFTQSASMNEEQFEESMDFIRECADGANVHDGLFVRPSDRDEIIAYLTENGLVD